MSFIAYRQSLSLWRPRIAFRTLGQECEQFAVGFKRRTRRYLRSIFIRRWVHWAQLRISSSCCLHSSSRLDLEHVIAQIVFKLVIRLTCVIHYFGKKSFTFELFHNLRQLALYFCIVFSYVLNKVNRRYVFLLQIRQDFLLFPHLV